MKLTVMERITLLQVLPPHGDITSLRIVRELKENLGFNEKERKEIGFREGEDWEKGCPKCGSKDTEEIDRSPNDSANMHCRACNHKGLSGPGRMAWAFAGQTDIPIGEKATDIIVDVLKKMNEKKNEDGTKGCLEEKHISIYEKFVEGKVDEEPATNGKVRKFDKEGVKK